MASALQGGFHVSFVDPYLHLDSLMDLEQTCRTSCVCSGCLLSVLNYRYDRYEYKVAGVIILCSGY